MIFNTDQGCQFTSEDWIGRLEELGVRISMDSLGALDGQRINRAVMAEFEVSGNLSEGKRHTFHAAIGTGTLVQAIQWLETPPNPWKSHPERRLQITLRNLDGEHKCGAGKGGLTWAPPRSRPILEASTLGSKIGLPPLPHHFNLERPTLIPLRINHRPPL